MSRQLEPSISPTLSITNQKSNTKKFVSMKQDPKKKVTILDEIDQEFEDIMSKRPFGLEQDEDEVQSKVTTRSQPKTRGRSPNTTASRKNQPNVIVKQNYVDTMFSLGDSFRTKISSVLMADEIL